MLYVKELSTDKECEYNPVTDTVKVLRKNLMMVSGYEIEEYDYTFNKEFFSEPYKK